MNPAPFVQGILEPVGTGAALGERAASVDVQITFMGVLADITKTKKLALNFGGMQTLRDILGELEDRYGEAFACRIYSSARAPRQLQMCTRIFINGNIVVDDSALDTPLPAPTKHGAATAVIVYFLPPCTGG